MSKAPAKRMPSDDLAIEQDGIEYRPHEGEWVDVLPGYTVGDLQDVTRWEKLMDDRQAIGDDEPEAMVAWMGRAEAVLGDMSRSIDRRLVGWSWTDGRGRPLPEPSPEVIAGLTWDELSYLMRIVRGQAETDRKNGSAPSRTTSSATASRSRRK